MKHTSIVRAVAAISGVLFISAAAQAQSSASLSLDEALKLAREQSEQVAIAQAGVLRARGQQYQARSQYFPQLYGSLGYTRTLKSEFSALQESDSTSEPTGETCG